MVMAITLEAQEDNTKVASRRYRAKVATVTIEHPAACIHHTGNQNLALPVSRSTLAHGRDPNQLAAPDFRMDMASSSRLWPIPCRRLW